MDAGSGGSPEAGRADADSGGPASTPIQAIQDGTIGVGQPVDLKKVFVTSTKQTTSTAFNFYVQEAQGKAPPPASGASASKASAY